ncbi:MAG: DUF5691 domain-containing protein [Bacteroidota bacterium]
MNLINTLVKNALLGTSKSAVSKSELPEAIASLIDTQSVDQEELLLKASGMAFSYRDAGFQHPTTEPEHVDVAPEETKPYTSSAALEILKRLQRDQLDDLIIHWLSSCRQAGYIAHPAYIPGFLASGTTDLTVRQYLPDVLGARGQWLARKNPDWAYLNQPEDHLWQHGKHEERKAFFKLLRKKEPVNARKLLSTTWSQESANHRADFLAFIRHGLSNEDLSFLESCINDKSRKVKSEAIKLLMLIPESSLSKKLIITAERYLQARKSKSLLGFGKESLAFEPAPIDLAWEKYGFPVESLDKQFTHEAYFFNGLLEVVRPSFWNDHLGLSSDKMMMILVKDKALKKFIPALVKATALHQDADWAKAILNMVYAEQEVVIEALSDLLPSLVTALSNEDKQYFFQKSIHHRAGKAGIGLVEYLNLCDFQWSLDFSKQALVKLYNNYADRGIQHYERDKFYRLNASLNPDVLKQKSIVLPPDGERRQTWRENMEKLFEAVELRKLINEAFNSK